MSVFDLLKQKLRKKKRPESSTPSLSQSRSVGAASSAPQENAVAPCAAASAISTVTVGTTDIQQRLWNEAYSQARINDEQTVEAYENILRTQFFQGDEGPTQPRSSEVCHLLQNEIAQNVDRARSQINQLVDSGLRRTEKDAKNRQNIGELLQVLMSVKEIADKAVMASPEAAIAWVGVYFGLEILMNPSNEASSNRQGIAHVMSRMDWYWNLSNLLLDETLSAARPQESIRELEKSIIRLYASLLVYQMKSVCYYKRNKFKRWMRDLPALEGWDDQLSDIKAAEAAVQDDINMYNTVVIQKDLGRIAMKTECWTEHLAHIGSAVEKQITLQKDMHEERENNMFLRDMCATNSEKTKQSLEQTKGGLLKDSYYWVLSNPLFLQWKEDPDRPLLWVNGDPGKGKTMLLCGIIDQLRISPEYNNLAYFFCQATDAEINNPMAVLRGLLHMLLKARPNVLSHVRKTHGYGTDVKKLFEGSNAWVSLKGIFNDVLQHSTQGTTYVIIDALDECTIDREKLLEFIQDQSSAHSHVKWLVSSRNESDILRHLDQTSSKVKLSLELNNDKVAEAVEAFIRCKVHELGKRNDYNPMLQELIRIKLAHGAQGTFLWVALVCRNLKNARAWEVQQKLEELPPGLYSFYEPMIKRIGASSHSKICQRILASTTLLYRPVTIIELVALVELFEDGGGLFDIQKSVRDLIGECGSFLTLGKNDTVGFVHQSGQDFLLKSGQLFPDGTTSVHWSIFSRSLSILHKTLKRDTYFLEKMDARIDDAQVPDPDPLASSRYSCVYWVSHLYASKAKSQASSLNDDEAVQVEKFLRDKYLYWLEGLSLCKKIPNCVTSMNELCSLVKKTKNSVELNKLVKDSRRFFMYHKEVIKNYPLQTYASALLFSPRESTIRTIFQYEEPKDIAIKPAMSKDWSPCLQTLEGHRDEVRCVVFSSDSTALVSASHDSTIKIWDTSNGECLQSLEGHDGPVRSVAFSHDSTKLVSASEDSTVKIWDTRATSWHCVQTLEGHKAAVTSASFSSDSTKLVSSSADFTIKIWDASSGKCLHNFEDHDSYISSVTFSPNSTTLASTSDNIIKVWDASNGKCLQSLEGHDGPVWSVAFSHDSTKLASTSQDNTVKIWDTNSGVCLQNLVGHGDFVYSVVFSHDSTKVLSGACNGSVKIWCANSGECLDTLLGHSRFVSSVAFSHQSTKVASASGDHTVKIWDTGNGECSWSPDDHTDWVSCVAFSPDSTKLATGSSDRTVRIWGVPSCDLLQVLKNYESCQSCLSSVAFSYDSTKLVSGTRSGTVALWDLGSEERLQTLHCSPEMWTLEIRSLVFSHDATKLAWIEVDSGGVGSGKIWDVGKSEHPQTFDVSGDWSRMSFNSTGSCLYNSDGCILIGSGQDIGTSDTAEEKNNVHPAAAVTSGGQWITFGQNTSVWVPSEYRYSNYDEAPNGRVVGIGVGSGRVWMCNFGLEE